MNINKQPNIMELDHIKNILDFIKKTNIESIRIDYDNFKSICNLSSAYSLKYEQLKQKLPYHINIIDELRANENAHSRILRGLFKQQSNGEYEILKSFISNLLMDFGITVNNPIVTDEKKRIDLLVQEKGKYALIFENKINYASFQNRQFARYIDKMKDEGYKEDQIFIIYLPPYHYTDIEEHCWYKSDISNESYKQSFENRLKTLTFKDNILPWLENNVLPNCRIKDIYIQSTIIQYIDHLKGKFDLREINKNMNMELQDYLKEELKFKNEPDLDYKKICDKLSEIKKVMNQLGNLKDSQIKECWEYWFNKLKYDFQDHKYVFIYDDEKSKIGVILKINELTFSILIEYHKSKNSIYYGLSKYCASDFICSEVQIILQPIIDSIGGFKNSPNWYAWKFTSFENAYKRLSHLIKEVEKHASVTLPTNQS